MKKLTTQNILDYTKAQKKNVKTPGNSKVTTNQSLQLIPVKIDENLVKKHNYKLSRNNIEYILQSAAEFKSNLQVAKELKVTLNAVMFHQYKHREEIAIIRETWTTKLADEPFAHKRLRIQALQDLYSKATEIYFNSSKESTQANVIRRMESLLNSARLEIEGNKVMFQGRLDIVHDDPALLESAKEIIDLVDFEVIK